MFFKVIKNGRVIDVIKNPIYVKYQPKNDIFLVCDESEAECVVSSDNETIWHVDVYPSISKQDIDTVGLVEIDEYEYKQLKCLNLKTPSEIIDAYTLMLLDGDML